MSRVLVPALLAVVVLTAGCAADAPPSAADRTAEPPASSATEASSPDASEPVSSAPAPKRRNATSSGKKRSDSSGKIAPSGFPVARADASRAHLLTAGTLPTAAGGATWTTRRTGPEPAHPVGSCQRTSLVDIGAVHAVRRAFAGPDDAHIRARQVVAKFADRKSAWRAHEVLRSWRDDCEEWLDKPHPEVGPMDEVDLDIGKGGHYRAVYGKKNDEAATGLGIVRKGRWLSIVTVRGAQQAVPARWARKAVVEIATSFS